jgi:hypothetical protein
MNGFGASWASMKSGATPSSYVTVYTSYNACMLKSAVSEPWIPGATYLNTGFTYDSLDRVVATTRPDGTTTTASFGAGSVFDATTVTDELGNRTVATRDAYGRSAPIDSSSLLGS